MNTSGLLQSIYDSMNRPKIEFIAYIYISLKNSFNLGFYTLLYLKYNHINGLVRV